MLRLRPLQARPPSTAGVSGAARSGRDRALQRSSGKALENSALTWQRRRTCSSADCAAAAVVHRAHSTLASELLYTCALHGGPDLLWNGSHSTSARRGMHAHKNPCRPHTPKTRTRQNPRYTDLTKTPAHAAAHATCNSPQPSAPLAQLTICQEHPAACMARTHCLGQPSSLPAHLPPHTRYDAPSRDTQQQHRRHLSMPVLAEVTGTSS